MRHRKVVAFALVFGVALLAACPTLVTRDGGLQRSGEPAAPNFDLLSHTGQKTSLERLRSSGPVVVAFYRGHW